MIIGDLHAGLFQSAAREIDRSSPGRPAGLDVVAKIAEHDYAVRVEIPTLANRLDRPGIRLGRPVFPSNQAIEIESESLQREFRDAPAVPGHERAPDAQIVESTQKIKCARNQCRALGAFKFVPIENLRAQLGARGIESGDFLKDRGIVGKAHFPPHGLEIQLGIDQSAVEVEYKSGDIDRVWNDGPPGNQRLKEIDPLYGAAARLRFRGALDFVIVKFQSLASCCAFFPIKRTPMSLKKYQTFCNQRRVMPALLMLFCVKALAHGGVMIEDDQCIVKFGFYKAHFTIYQPQSSQNQEFCEDLPNAGPTIFVLYYLHNSLSRVPVDFRIIRNFTDLGSFVKWADLEKSGDLEAYSVFYQPALLRPEGVLMVEHDFETTGDYIGIITAKHPTQDKVYRAVFPFRVGHGKLFYGILIGAALAAFYLVLRFRLYALLLPVKSGKYGSSKPR